MARFDLRKWAYGRLDEGQGGGAIEGLLEEIDGLEASIRGALAMLPISESTDTTRAILNIALCLPIDTLFVPVSPKRLKVLDDGHAT